MPDYTFLPVPSPPPGANIHPSQLTGPGKVQEVFKRGLYYHPKKKYTSTVSSLPGPLVVCPACKKQLGSEWERDIHYLERHILGLAQDVVDAEDMIKTANYDGMMGKGRHILGPWVFFQEPEVYADEDGDAIPGKIYYPPSNCYHWKDGMGWIKPNMLPPKARMWCMQTFVNHTLATQKH